MMGYLIVGRADFVEQKRVGFEDGNRKGSFYY